MRRSTFAARRSNTRRSPAASSSARLRSVMSVMLPRISRCRRDCSRTQRTSQGMSLPRRPGTAIRAPAPRPPASGRTARDSRATKRSVRLLRRAQRVGAALSSASRSILKKRTAFSLRSTRRFYVEIDDDDDFRRVLDERAIARFAVSQRRFRRLAIGGVAQADDEHVAPLHARLADGDLGRRTARRCCADRCLVRRRSTCVSSRRAASCSSCAGASVCGELRQQEAERAADDLGFGVTEHALAGGVEGSMWPASSTVMITSLTWSSTACSWLAVLSRSSRVSAVASSDMSCIERTMPRRSSSVRA